MPYEGKGTDVTADITTDPVWDISDSPIRINPTNTYLSVSSDLTIMPGVEVQIAPGKGISFDGACTKFTAKGTEAEPINFTGTLGVLTGWAWPSPMIVPLRVEPTTDMNLSMSTSTTPAVPCSALAADTMDQVHLAVHPQRTVTPVTTP